MVLCVGSDRAAIRDADARRFKRGGMGGLFLALAVSTGAMANCPTWHVLQTGQTASANDVMDNFNHTLNCPNFAGNVGIGTGSPAAPLEVMRNTGSGIEAPLLRLNSYDTQPNNGGSIL